MRVTIILFSIFAVAGAARAQERFDAPDGAVRALAHAAAQDDTHALVQILGPGSEGLISSGDPVEDRNARKRFATAAAEATKLEQTEPGEVIVRAGKDDWPLPIPLTKDEQGWYFDTDAGYQEMLNRRIGRNELDTVATCRVYTDAQRRYAAMMGDYAQRFRSDPGQRNGLYWEGDDSPLGPLVAKAASEGYSQPGAPYHGYTFRILTAQGPSAPGGAHGYVEDGKMKSGFAMVAAPAEYGKSGVMTFIVGPLGIVYEKDLGPSTAESARKITRFDPDESWTPVRD
jgi:Protein of unknown function (DUF2950)